MKKKLIVLYEENKNNPKGTWSGTSYQLREALKEYYDVIFVDSSDIRIIQLIRMISKKIEKKTASYLFKPLYEELHKLEINSRLKEYKDIPVLQISENVETKNPFYLYRDMAYACYPYVLDKLKNDNHDYGHGMLNSISKKSLKQRIKREEKLQDKASGIFYMGQWVSDLMKEYYPEYNEKTYHVGGGLNNELVLKEKNKNNNKKTILFVGIDFKRKGGELLLKAFSKLREKHGDKIELIIAGPEKKEEKDGVKFIGKASKEELSNLFSSSDVFCMPSRFEAYGLVFCEALSYGLPIVAYNDFEMSHFVENGKNGYLINNYNENELEECLNKAINNKDMKEYINRNIDKYRCVYSWKNVAERIYSVIK